MNNPEFDPKDKRIQSVKKAIADPVLFARHILGVELWDKQIEILQSIRDNRKTAIKACHATGKTFVLAIAVLWWLARYDDGVVITTSATLRQVQSQLWAEIRGLAGRAKVSYPEVHRTELKLRGEDNFAMGLSTNRAENFQGYHGKHILIIADEAPGIEESIWEATAGIMAGGDVHLVMAGNPTTPSGTFYEAFHRERASWNCITIDAFSSPNLRGLTLEQLLQMDPRNGGPMDDNVVPYLTLRRWVFEQHRAWWHGDQSSSPLWMSRVLGEFPDQASDTLFKLRWLEQARRRPLSDAVPDDAGGLVAGVDVGGGSAETAVYVCEQRPRGYRIIDLGAWRAADTRGNVVRFLEPYRKRLTTVRVDATGIGHNFALHLKDLKFPVEFIQVGSACVSKPNLHENDPARRFVNEKARYFQNLADFFERDEIEGLADEETFAQLADLRFELDSRGRMKIESKEDARARHRSSPDRADALMLAIGDRRKPNRSEYLTREWADMYRKDGLSEEQIALKLDVSVFELRNLQKRQLPPELAYMRSLLETKCPRCEQRIDIDAPRMSLGGLVWHADPECDKKSASLTRGQV